MKENIEKMMIHSGMTIKDMRTDLKRPKFKVIIGEVIGALLGCELPSFVKQETLHNFIDRLSETQVALLYREMCHAVFRAAALGIEEQYGLDKDE